MKKIILTFLMVLLVLPTGLMAKEYDPGEGSISQVRDKGAPEEVSIFVEDLAVRYARELERSTRNRILSIQPGLASDNPYLIGQQEAHAKRIAQDALLSIFRDSIEQVDILQSLRAYSEGLTSTRLRITPDDFEFSGPSLKPAFHEGNKIDRVRRTPFLSIQSGLRLTDDTHLTPMIQADLADLTSRLIYDPMAGGDLRFSLGHPITSYSSVEMIYLRTPTDIENIVGTYRLGF